MGERRHNEKTPIPGSWGELIRTLRKERGLTQEELAEALAERLGKYSRQNIVSQWELGEHTPTDMETHAALASILGVSVGELFFRAWFPMEPSLGAAICALTPAQQTEMLHLVKARIGLEHEGEDFLIIEDDGTIQAWQELVAARPSPEQLAACVKIVQFPALPDDMDPAQTIPHPRTGTNGT